MATLPTEIITIILSKLPVKSLLRFKYVCKLWYSILKTPNFIKLHLNQTLISNSDLHLLLYYPFLYSAQLHSQISFSKLRHPLEPHQVHFLGTCNGIICISDPSNTDVVLFNPLTNSRRKLPSLEIPEINPNFVLFGFGYDSKSDDYKVLRIAQGFKVGQVLHEEAQVYSLNNNSWKCAKGTRTLPFYLFDPAGDAHGVLVSEGLHYIVVPKDSNSREHTITKFDLRTESFSFMAYPKYDDDDKDKTCNTVLTLTQLSGCLCLVVNYHIGFILDRVDLWVMKEYGKKESWFRLFSIRGDSVGSSMQMKPIVYSTDGRRILLEIDLLVFGWYDLESKKVAKFTPDGLPESNIETAVFVGSLVPVVDELHSQKGTLPRKNKNKNKNNVDKFLSVGFKLRL